MFILATPGCTSVTKLARGYGQNYEQILDGTDGNRTEARLHSRKCNPDSSL
jgi:hypothetical protein